MSKNKLIDYKLPTGEVFTACVPENYTKDSPIMAFTSGFAYNNGKLPRDIVNAVVENNTDTIVVFPHYFSTVTKGQDIYNTLVDNLNLNNPMMATGGFSAASNEGGRAMASLANSETKIGRKALFLVDGDLTENGKHAFPESEFETIRNENPVVISLAQPNYWEHQKKHLKMPILYVVPDKLPPKEEYDANYKNIYGKYHIGQLMEFFDQGLYQKFNDFARGVGKLPKDGYHYKYYDPKTDQIIDIDPNDAASLFNIQAEKNTTLKFNNLTEITPIACNDKELGNILNDIRNCISNTGFASGGYSSPGYSSTTKVPSLIPMEIFNFMKSSNKLLTAILKETEYISMIGESIKEEDYILGKYGEELLKDDRKPEVETVIIPTKPPVKDDYYVVNLGNTEAKNNELQQTTFKYSDTQEIIVVSEGDKIKDVELKLEYNQDWQAKDAKEEIISNKNKEFSFEYTDIYIEDNIVKIKFNNPNLTNLTFDEIKTIFGRNFK